MAIKKIFAGEDLEANREIIVTELVLCYMPPSYDPALFYTLFRSNLQKCIPTIKWFVSSEQIRTHLGDSIKKKIG